jgi:FMN phosphatase YigB (HAD superfamily)
MIYTIIFDWKRTLYDPENASLADGSIEVLDFILSQNIPIFLIGKGQQEMYDEVTRLGVSKYFQDIVFVKESKDPKHFLKYVNLYNPKNTIVIGDRIKSEIKIGNSVGANTVWIKKGKFANEEAESDEEKPDYIISDLLEIINLDLFIR